MTDGDGLTGVTVMKLQFVYQFLTQSQCNLSASLLPLNLLNEKELKYDFGEIVRENFPINYQYGRCRMMAACPASEANCVINCAPLDMMQISPRACAVNEFFDCRLGIFQMVLSSPPAGPTAVLDFFESKTIIVYIPTNQDQFHLNPGSNCSSGVIEKMKMKLTPDCSCGNVGLGSTMNEHERNASDMVINKYPMAVALLTKIEGKTAYAFQCNGVILDDTYVLTSAVCITKIHKPKYVAAGKFPTIEDPLHPKSYFVDLMAASVHDIAAYTIHNDFKKGKNLHNYDLGMISVRNKFVFNLDIQPVCLPFKYITHRFLDKKLTYIGYTPEELGDTNYIYELPMKVIPKENCPPTVETDPTFTLSNQLCVSIQRNTSKEFEGGGIYYEDPSNGRLYLAGISSGLGTPNNFSNPGYRVNVAKMMEWINITAVCHTICQR